VGKDEARRTMSALRVIISRDIFAARLTRRAAARDVVCLEAAIRPFGSGRVVLMNLRCAMIVLSGMFLVHPAVASPVTLTIKSHKFTPVEIHVKANMPSEFLIVNQDADVEEFDSTSLKVEKVVSGNAQGSVRIRPLAPGHYPFMGEFHAETAQGVVIAE
jgi:hypothetical protein